MGQDRTFWDFNACDFEKNILSFKTKFLFLFKNKNEIQNKLRKASHMSPNISDFEMDQINLCVWSLF